MLRPAFALAVLAGSATLLGPMASAQARTTLACYPTAKVAPRACVVFAAPGPVVRQLRVSLRSLRWKNWGTGRATGTGRLQRDGKRAGVRLVADRRLDSGIGGSTFYSRLTLIDRAGHRQSLGLDSFTEAS